MPWRDIDFGAGSKGLGYLAKGAGSKACCKGRPIEVRVGQVVRRWLNGLVMDLCNVMGEGP